MKNYMIKSGAWYGGECNARLACSACRYDKQAFCFDFVPGYRDNRISLRLALTTDPVQPRLTTKGGAWFYDADICRSAYRYFGVPGFCYGARGLRLALDQAQPQRILRCGSWFGDGRRARSASRNHFQPGDRNHYFGFRLALNPAQPSRAIRGGSWFDGVRTACRYRLAPGNRDDDIGLHLALDTDPAQSQQENIQ